MLPTKYDGLAAEMFRCLRARADEMSAWEKQGLIESEGCHIVVKNPHRMVLIAAAARIPALAHPRPAELQTAYAGRADTAAPNSARKPSSFN